MKTIKKNISIQNLIYIYLILLPFVDVITSLTTRFKLMPISLGQVVKTVALMVMGIYLLFYSKHRKQNIIAISVLTSFSILYLINRFISPYFSLLTEMQYIMRYVHLPVIFLTFKDLVDSNKLNIRTLEKAVIINTISIAAMLFLAWITNTSFLSYERLLGGNIGWFYAANEISVIAMVGMGFVLNKVIKKPVLIPLYYILLIIFLSIGTKVAIYGLMSIIFAFLIWSFFIQKKYLLTIIMAITTVLVLVFFNPTKLVVNNSFREAIQQSSLKKEIKDEILKEDQIVKFKEYDSKIITVLDTILSQRIQYLEIKNKEFLKSNVLNKILGLGHVTTPEKNYKDVEMDIFGLMYDYGLLGFLIYLAMFVNWFVLSLKALKYNYRDALTITSILTILIAIGVGAVIGHTYFSPAVNIYIAIFATIIYKKSVPEKLKEKDKKKIGIITLHLGFGGVEDATANLANMLKDDYDVNIINLYNIEKAFIIDSKINLIQLSNLEPNKDEFIKAFEEKNLINILREGFLSLKILYLRTNLVSKHLLNNEYDIIISTRILYSKLINYLDIPSKKIAIEHKHHNNNKKYINNLKKYTKNLDYLITVSKELKEDYEDVLKCKVENIPNTLAVLEDSTTLPANKRKEIILAAGRLSKEKGFDDLIDVFKIINDKYPSYQLKIAGDGDEKENLNNKIKEYNLESKVELTGFLNKEDIYKLYGESKLFLMTSLEESFGIVVLEAQHFKLPIIAFSTATGVVELLDGSGIVIEDRDKIKMAEKAIELIEDKEEYNLLSEQSYLNSKNYSFEKLKDIWLDFLKEV